MLRLGIGMVLILLAQGFGSFCAAAEIEMSSIEANGQMYSNVTVSSTTKNRVVLRHDGGLVTINGADFNAETRRQLIEAGVLLEPTAAKKASRGFVWFGKPVRLWFSGSTTKEGGQSGTNTSESASFAAQIGSRVETEARSRSGYSPEKLASSVSVGIVLGICGLVFALYMFRCWCLFRICKKGSGNGSMLVFLPILRWLPLADAARMKRGLVWIPLFAWMGLYLPPPLPKVGWFTFAYAFVVGALWLTTLVLFFIWCMKICKQLQCSSFFGVLLLLPVLDWIALLYLAFSEGKPELIKTGGGGGPGRIAIAI